MLLSCPPQGNDCSLLSKLFPRLLLKNTEVHTISKLEISHHDMRHPCSLCDKQLPLERGSPPESALSPVTEMITALCVNILKMRKMISHSLSWGMGEGGTKAFQ